MGLSSASSQLRILLPALVAFLSASPTHAITLTFDDLNGAGIQNYGVGGLAWDGWGAQDDAGYMAGLANHYGSPSGEYAASGRAVWRAVESAPGSCCVLAPFNFVGGYFSTYAMYDDFWSHSGTSLTIDGFRNGQLVDSATISLTPSYVWWSVVLDGVDTLAFSPTGGFWSSGWLMDDFTYTIAGEGASPVPEPHTLMLIGTGGLLLAGARRIRRERA